MSEVRELSDRCDEVGFVVPPDLFRRPELLPCFHALEVLQTVSAGVDRVLPHLPCGVALCDANGVHGRAGRVGARRCARCPARHPRLAADQARGRWDSRTAGELAGSSALVVGAGDLGAMLVNAARGAVADTAALPAELQARRLRVVRDVVSRSH